MPPEPRQRRRRRRNESEGNVERRMRWLEERRALGDRTGEVLREASRVRDEQLGALPKAPPGAPGTVNWTPLGPSAVYHGQAFGNPVVSGRILGIQVAPGATRAYVVAGDGGLWRWTVDTTQVPPLERWFPIDDFTMSPSNTPGVSANALSCGDVVVNFGANADADQIFLATGEAHANGAGTAAAGFGGAGGQFAGVGVRVSAGGVVPRVWNLEATVQLTNQGIFRLEIDPDDSRVVWAATTIGIHQRPAAAVGAVQAAWPRVNGDLPNPGNAVTDIRIAGSTAAGNKVIWAAFLNAGVFTSANNGVNWVAVPELPPVPAAPAVPVLPGRISLAVAPSNPAIVYALDQRGRLYRFDGARFRRLQQVPTQQVLLRGQGFYDLAIAVDPGNSNIVYLGGATVQSQQDAAGQRTFEASAYRGTVTPAGTTFRFGFDTTNNNTDTRASRDATYIGQGMHADAHAITFGRTAGGALDPTDVWYGNDGGVYRSMASGANGTFRSRNAGLSTIQLTYFASHPANESVVLAGCQDNGTVLGRGDQAWFEAPPGDGGGSAIDPNHPYRMMRESHDGNLSFSTDGGVSGNWTFSPPPFVGDPTTFYSPLATEPPSGAPPPPPPALPAPAGVLYGTNRVWASFDWGNTWVTLPTAAAPATAVADRIDAGNMVVRMVWAATNDVFVATTQNVFHLQRAGAAWAQVAPSPLPTAGLPAARNITGLGVVNVATRDLYVCLGGAGVDHVWWFDSPNARWQPTDLTAAPAPAPPPVNPAFDAPTYCLATDPGAPNDIYVGTDIGVWRGQRGAIAPVPAPPASIWRWQWSLFSQGLPEATVIDLQVHPMHRLLRAATHGRGAWEIQLGAAAGLDPDLYVRMNAADNGRRFVVARAAADPDAVGFTVNWTMSTDVKVRRGVAAQAAPAFPGLIRLTTPRTTGANVRRWQNHALRRGFNLGPLGADGEFGPSSQTAAVAVQQRYTLAPIDGQVGRLTWDSTCSYPALPARLDHTQFVADVHEDIDKLTRVQIADATGVNRVLVQVHSRGSTAVPFATLRVLLLLAKFVGGVAPNLPADYSARLVAGDATAWLGATGWVFADPANPYRSPVVDLTAREPQVVEWNVDFAALGFAAGDQVLALVMMTTPTDQLAAVQVNPQTLVETERRVAARLLRLDAVAVIL